MANYATNTPCGVVKTPIQHTDCLVDRASAVSPTVLPLQVRTTATAIDTQTSPEAFEIGLRCLAERLLEINNLTPVDESPEGDVVVMWAFPDHAQPAYPYAIFRDITPA